MGDWRREAAHEAIEGLGRAPVFLALVGGEFERDHRAVEAERTGETARIVLDEFGGAGRADDHRLRLESRGGVTHGRLEEFRRVAAEVARLEGRVGDRRPRVAALDHGEEQVGVGVALRRVQHVVQAAHRGRDAHCADVGRALVGPDRELHGQTSSRTRRRSGRAKSSARSPACS